jgi:hypothetical protein
MGNRHSKCSTCSQRQALKRKRPDAAPINRPDLGQCVWHDKQGHVCPNPAVHHGRAVFCEAHRCKGCDNTTKMGNAYYLCSTCIAGRLSHWPKRKVEDEQEDSESDEPEANATLRKLRSFQGEDAYEPPKKRARVE